MTDLNLPRFVADLHADRIGVFSPQTMPLTPPDWNWSVFFRDTVLPVIDDPDTGRYLFDSGTEWDTSPDAVHDIRQQSINLMAAGRFHLPHRQCWIEDPFEVIGVRHCMMAVQRAGEIAVSAFVESPKTHRFFYLGGDLVLQPVVPSNKFLFAWAATPDTMPEVDAGRQELLGNADFAIRRFIVQSVARPFVKVDDHFETS